MIPCLPDRTVYDRFDVIARHLEGRDVLDLGVVDARYAKTGAGERIRKPTFLFRRLAEANPRVLGLDIDEAGIEILRDMGYQVRCDDAITMDLGRRFDTIVAGEIIEHVPDAGAFLRNLRRHLKDDGVLIVSTPNPFYAKQRWKIWRYRVPSVHEDHTCWFDPITLGHLMRISGLEPVEAWWVQPDRQLLKSWNRLLRGYFSHSFMMLARRAPEPPGPAASVPAPAPASAASS
jgi:2-polyprenyl-3-methyl-5-hydroxy-6-metoxy-1,4-benzoquinol methylase